MAVEPTVSPSWLNRPTKAGAESAAEARRDERAAEGERDAVDQGFAHAQQAGRERGLDGAADRLVAGEAEVDGHGRAHLARSGHREDREQDRVALLLDERGVDRDQGLVQAQHHQGQEQAAEHEARARAAVGQQPVGERADRGGDLATTYIRPKIVTRPEISTVRVGVTRTSSASGTHLRHHFSTYTARTAAPSAPSTPPWPGRASGRRRRCSRRPGRR